MPKNIKLTLYVYMKVLKPTTDEQTFKVIPRDYDTTLTLSLRDDQTNVTVDYDPTVVKENDYLVYTGVFNLVEGHYYDVKLGRDYGLWQQNDEVWNLNATTWDELQPEVISNVVEKIFCTDQEIDQSENKRYTINKNKYKSDTSYDKEYIIYE